MPIFAKMDQEVFYKDQYEQSLAQKNEINASLGTPIGILTAFIAGLYYAVTSFNFDFNKNLALSVIFTALSLVACILLALSIYRLIKAYSDFQNGLGYAYLNDADVLDGYYQSLLASYAGANGTVSDADQKQALAEYDAYILGELIRNSGINQRNNREKNFQRFKCQQFLIYALISLSLLIIPFGIDFGANKGKDKTQKVTIAQKVPVEVSLKYDDTIKRLIINSKDHGKKQQRPASTPTIPAR